MVPSSVVKIVSKIRAAAAADKDDVVDDDDDDDRSFCRRRKTVSVLAVTLPDDSWETS